MKLPGHKADNQRKLTQRRSLSPSLLNHMPP